nr:Gfo/Idh/MocA family oxidoreductase [Acuticoccus mangrovi]
MIHRTAYRDWANRSGAPWPARGEFQVGCTFEHAGYTLGPLVALFGPVRTVTAHSALVIADKQTDPPLPDPAPDMSVALLTFDGGVTARMTNSVIAPYDHRLRLFGETGMLSLAEPWTYASPVRLSRPATSRLARLAERRLGWRPTETVPPVRKPALPTRRGVPTMDFMRGVAELADALREGRPCRLSSELAVHITEVTEVVQHPDRFAMPYSVTSTVPPIAPMPWAAA